MTQENKIFKCGSCGKEIKVLKEGGNPDVPTCCGDKMGLKE